MYVINQMKKIVIIFFALVYLASTAGVAWSNFYCCGKLKETYFFKSENLSKDCKMDKKVPGCCNTQTFSFKVKDDHSPSVQVKTSGANSVKIFYPVFDLLANSLNISFTSHSFSILHDPPLTGKQPVYLSACNFRI